MLAIPALRSWRQKDPEFHSETPSQKLKKKKKSGYRWFFIGETVQEIGMEVKFLQK
jgi:hypothetical protein